MLLRLLTLSFILLADTPLWTLTAQAPDSDTESSQSLYFDYSEADVFEHDKSPRIDVGSLVSQMDVYTVEFKARSRQPWKEFIKRRTTFLFDEGVITITCDSEYAYGPDTKIDQEGRIVLDENTYESARFTLGIRESGAGISGSGYGNYELGQWYHLALVVDYSKRKSTMYVVAQERTPFYDRIRKIEMDHTENSAQDRAEHPNLFLGGYPERIGFSGYLDDVRIWKGARTEEQIIAYSYADLPTDERADLLALYDFENLQSGSDLVTDQTGNGHDAKLVDFDLADPNNFIGDGLVVKAKEEETSDEKIKEDTSESEEDGPEVAPGFFTMRAVEGEGEPQKVSHIGLANAQSNKIQRVTADMIDEENSVVLKFKIQIFAETDQQYITTLITETQAGPKIFSYSKEDTKLKLEALPDQEQIGDQHKFILDAILDDSEVETGYFRIRPVNDNTLQLSRNADSESFDLTYTPIDYPDISSTPLLARWQLTPSFSIPPGWSFDYGLVDEVTHVKPCIPKHLIKLNASNADQIETSLKRPSVVISEDSEKEIKFGDQQQIIVSPIHKNEFVFIPSSNEEVSINRKIVFSPNQAGEYTIPLQWRAANTFYAENKDKCKDKEDIKIKVYKVNAMGESFGGPGMEGMGMEMPGMEMPEMEMPGMLEELEEITVARDLEKFQTMVKKVALSASEYLIFELQDGDLNENDCTCNTVTFYFE